MQKFCGADTVQLLEFAIEVADTAEACFIGNFGDAFFRLLAQQTRGVGGAYRIDVFGVLNAAAFAKCATQIHAMYPERCSVGGQMVKKMIESYENSIKTK